MNFMLCLNGKPGFDEWADLDGSNFPEVTKKNISTEILESEGGKRIFLSAEPEIGYVFKQWTLNGEFLSSSINYEFVMPFEDVSIIGHFDKIEPPIITITTPSLNSSYLVEEKINISADVQSNKAYITKVEFFVNGNVEASLNDLPYTFIWDNPSPGEHDVFVKAYDTSGQFAISEIRTFTVIDKPNSAPKVSISSPGEGEGFTVGESVTITADASDADGEVAKVDFYRDGTLLGTDSAYPYSITWGDLPKGNHVLTAKATDDKGATAVSSAVSITVSDKENSAPKVSISSPGEGEGFTVGESVTIAADASDADGEIAKVDFYRDGTLLGTDIAYPYSITWGDLPKGSHVLTAKATDDKGATAVSSAVSITVSEK
ncbi:Ig-like domain-containing protein, partial [Algoriphagus sp. AGSA1]|uniref:Ig-like domain-containing protein n=1 Tax=Algoriphagus sp. AGSA1 TaxID=2907213 RepID=UPI001F29D8A5